MHVIDLVRYLGGNPRPVSVYGATYQKLFDRKGEIGKPKYLSSSLTDHDISDVENMASAFIRFDNGRSFLIDAPFCLNLKNDKEDIELFGTKAGAKISPEVEILERLTIT